jgi:hypothetical protein
VAASGQQGQGQGQRLYQLARAGGLLLHVNPGNAVLRGTFEDNLTGANKICNNVMK